ncbi:MAG: TonB-dependent siderophore receptor, partial [Comamonadaceae bacterium]
MRQARDRPETGAARPPAQKEVILRMTHSNAPSLAAAQRAPSSPRFALRPAALASLLAVAGGLLAAAQAHAQPAPSQAAARSYQIAPGALGPALSAFAGQAGVTVSFTPQQTRELRTPGLQGAFSVEQGFTQLLAGTGLRAVARDGGGYTLQPTAGPATTSAAGAQSLQEVTVTADAPLQPDDVSPAYAGGQLARGARLGMLGQTDVMEAPFHITSYTSRSLEDRQVTTLGEALSVDPSVRSAAPSGDVADAFFVRGFAMGDNNIGEIAFDGLYGVAPNYRLLTDYAERVEVLKGPAALVYGMSPNSGIGGGINVVPKRATQDLTRVRADYGTRTQAG